MSFKIIKAKLNTYEEYDIHRGKLNSSTSEHELDIITTSITKVTNNIDSNHSKTKQKNRNKEAHSKIGNTEKENKKITHKKR